MQTISSTKIDYEALSERIPGDGDREFMLETIRSLDGRIGDCVLAQVIQRGPRQNAIEFAGTIRGHQIVLGINPDTGFYVQSSVPRIAEDYARKFIDEINA